MRLPNRTHISPYYYSKYPLDFKSFSIYSILFLYISCAKTAFTPELPGAATPMATNNQKLTIEIRSWIMCIWFT